MIGLGEVGANSLLILLAHTLQHRIRVKSRSLEQVLRARSDLLYYMTGEHIGGKGLSNDLENALWLLHDDWMLPGNGISLDLGFMTCLKGSDKAAQASIDN